MASTLFLYLGVVSVSCAAYLSEHDIDRLEALFKEPHHFDALSSASWSSIGLKALNRTVPPVHLALFVFCHSNTSTSPPCDRLLVPHDTWAPYCDNHPNPLSHTCSHAHMLTQWIWFRFLFFATCRLRVVWLKDLVKQVTWQARTMLCE